MKKLVFDVFEPNSEFILARICLSRIVCDYKQQLGEKDG